MIFKKIYHLFDRLEDKIRRRLSYYPLFYAFFGGAGVIIFWRGIWHTMDAVMEFFFMTPELVSSTSNIGLPWWDGPLSIIIGTLLLLPIGLFVPSFIGSEIIISGIKGEKKIVEKSEEEILADVAASEVMMREIKTMTQRLESIEEKLSNKG